MVHIAFPTSPNDAHNRYYTLPLTDSNGGDGLAPRRINFEKVGLEYGPKGEVKSYALPIAHAANAELQNLTYRPGDAFHFEDANFKIDIEISR